MSRKFKFDQEWEQAVELLSEQEAANAREAIVNYQLTGEMPAGLPPQTQMILLLVKPMIDRRRRASAAARLRRKCTKATARPDNTATTPCDITIGLCETIAAHNDAVAAFYSTPAAPCDAAVEPDNITEVQEIATAPAAVTAKTVAIPRINKKKSDFMADVARQRLRARSAREARRFPSRKGLRCGAR